MMNTEMTFAALIGIDWADHKHDICLALPEGGGLEHSTLEHTPEAIAIWVAGLQERFGGGRIAIALEQARGPLLYALCRYDNLVLYPINPKSLARFREALKPSGAKDDRSDAAWLVQMLRHHRQSLPVWLPDDTATRQLAALVEARRRFVHLRTQLLNQLTAALKAFFPQALVLAGEDLGSRLATDFLLKWPSLPALQKAKASTVRAFYYGHNCRSETLIQERLEVIQTAVALTEDEAILAPSILLVETLARQLATLRPAIAQYERRIDELFAAHPDREIFASLPGAGAALAPRLLAACGSRRERFPDAASLQCAAGIAPVTERSGKLQHWVHMRWSCPKFVRQSFHEFAGCSIRFCDWARCCYEQLRARGKGHHAAVRALAFKWLRIIWRCWQDRKVYCDA
ncbi:MAG: IS110 family transposase, partial [Acidobacteria bacterium]|nr:IS110 family transposase [Acidobacteriota bacterium]